MLSKLFSSSSKIVSIAKTQQLYSSRTVVKKRIYNPIFFCTQNNWKSLNIAYFSTLQNNDNGFKKPTNLLTSKFQEKNQNFSTTPNKPATSNDLGTQTKEIKEWWNQKPFEQGNKEEVQTFLNHYRNGIFNHNAKKFVRLNGKQLMNMTEEQFKERSPEIGEVLFPESAADFFDRLIEKSKIASIATAKRKDMKLPKEPMKYMAGNRQSEFDQFLKPFKETFHSFETRVIDKQKRWLTWVFGPAGIGKTRFCMELLNQLQSMLENSPEYETRWKEYFCNRLTLILDLKNNGYEVEYWERALPTDTLLAMRTFLQFYCPDYEVHKNVKQEILKMQAMNRDNFILYFTSRNVLKFIANGTLKPFNSTENYKPPKMIHLVVDEIQFLDKDGLKVNYGVYDESNQGKLESMGAQIFRSLSAAASTSPSSLFVFPSFTGVVLDRSTLDPSGNVTLNVGLRLLDFESFKNLAIENFQLKLPEQTLKLCYAVCGGNLCVINCLFEVINKHRILPIFDNILDELAATVQSKLETDVWEGEGYLALYAAISGIAIKDKELLIRPDIKMTLHQLIGIGGCSITERHLSYTAEQVAYFIQVPFVVALQALRISNNPRHHQLALLASFLLKRVGNPKSKQDAFFRLIALRFLAAGELSKHGMLLNSSSTTLIPQDLFYGAISSVAFDKLEFQIPEDMQFRTVQQEWCVKSKIANVSSIIKSSLDYMTDNEDLDLNDPASWKAKNGKYLMSAIRFDGHRDAMDGVILVRFVKQKTNDQNQPEFENGLLWYNAVTTGSSEDNFLRGSEVETRIAKFQALSEKFSSVKHALVLISNRQAQRAAIEKVKKCDLPVVLIEDSQDDNIEQKPISSLENVFGPSIAPWFQFFPLK